MRVPNCSFLRVSRRWPPASLVTGPARGTGSGSGSGSRSGADADADTDAVDDRRCRFPPGRGRQQRPRHRSCRPHRRRPPRASSARAEPRPVVAALPPAERAGRRDGQGAIPSPLSSSRYADLRRGRTSRASGSSPPDPSTSGVTSPTEVNLRVTARGSGTAEIRQKLARRINPVWDAGLGGNPYLLRTRRPGGPPAPRDRKRTEGTWGKPSVACPRQGVPQHATAIMQSHTGERPCVPHVRP